jgi:hypothetical protein
MSFEDTEGGGGHGEELIYHRDAETPSFEKKYGSNSNLIVDRRTANRKSPSDPKLRALCVSVVNQFFSVSSAPLCALLNMERSQRINLHRIAALNRQDRNNTVAENRRGGPFA